MPASATLTGRDVILIWRWCMAILSLSDSIHLRVPDRAKLPCGSWAMATYPPPICAAFTFAFHFVTSTPFTSNQAVSISPPGNINSRSAPDA